VSDGSQVSHSHCVYILQISKYVERELLNHSLMLHPHIIQVCHWSGNPPPSLSQMANSDCTGLQPARLPCSMGEIRHCTTSKWSLLLPADPPALNDPGFCNQNVCCAAYPGYAQEDASVRMWMGLRVGSVYQHQSRNFGGGGGVRFYFGKSFVPPHRCQAVTSIKR
jgi:hypothetical protein